VRLEADVRAALDKAAKAEDRPQAYLVRQFVRDALREKEFLK
jgi:predicted transcriptional regulator